MSHVQTVVEKMLADLTEVRNVLARSVATEAVRRMNVLINTLESSGNQTEALRIAAKVLEGFNSKTVRNVGITATALGIIALLIPFSLAAFGFSAAGSVSGSAAATWQATFGGAVATGSTFATFQSFMMGAGAATMTTAGSILTPFGWMLSGLSWLFSKTSQA
ncbi:hypothetical protein CALVIDRAFT_603550 [Calocera viscosa TUFC12733]|uniref:Uncharacterized protein n=1 Tax=Calocera viscosa (strain TUFC12733) TaxID=1330018 RepID=A0A167FKL5_CALVF|nr:hypothetical protein CALVIDRAFT_603550 [Calocera viscosa TUFC12733]